MQTFFQATSKSTFKKSESRLTQQGRRGYLTAVAAMSFDNRTIKAFGPKKSDLCHTKIPGSTEWDLRSIKRGIPRLRDVESDQGICTRMCCCLAEYEVGSCGRCTRMLPLPARNIAPGNVALVLSPPRTRSLPGAFFAPVLSVERHSVPFLPDGVELR